MNNNSQNLESKRESINFSDTDKISLPIDPKTNRESELTQEKDITISHHINEQATQLESINNLKEDENSKKVTLDSESEKKNPQNKDETFHQEESEKCIHIVQAKNRLKYSNKIINVKNRSEQNLMNVRNGNKFTPQYVNNVESVQFKKPSRTRNVVMSSPPPRNGLDSRAKRFNQPGKDLRASSPMLSRFMKQSRQLFNGPNVYSSAIHPEPSYKRKMESRSVYNFSKKRRQDDKNLNPYCVVDYEDENSEEEENISLNFWNKREMTRSVSNNPIKNNQFTSSRKFIEDLIEQKKKNNANKINVGCCNNSSKKIGLKKKFKYLVNSSVQTESEQNVKSIDTSSRPLGRGLEQFLKSRRENLKQNWSQTAPQSYYKINWEENRSVNNGTFYYLDIF